MFTKWAAICVAVSHLHAVSILIVDDGGRGIGDCVEWITLHRPCGKHSLGLCINRGDMHLPALVGA